MKKLSFVILPLLFIAILSPDPISARRKKNNEPPRTQKPGKPGSLKVLNELHELYTDVAISMSATIRPGQRGISKRFKCGEVVEMPAGEYHRVEYQVDGKVNNRRTVISLMGSMVIEEGKCTTVTLAPPEGIKVVVFEKIRSNENKIMVSREMKAVDGLTIAGIYSDKGDGRPGPAPLPVATITPEGSTEPIAEGNMQYG